MNKDEKEFIVKLRQPTKSVSRHGHALFYFASEVFKAIEEAGGKVEFINDDEAKHDN